MKEGFKEFLGSKKTDLIKDEFLLPIFIDELLREKKAEVKVLETDEKWFGVTYAEDRDTVVEAFKELVDKGVYASNLYAE